jgi:hypothetical protein
MTAGSLGPATLVVLPATIGAHAGLAEPGGGRPRWVFRYRGQEWFDPWLLAALNPLAAVAAADGGWDVALDGDREQQPGAPLSNQLATLRGPGIEVRCTSRRIDLDLDPTWHAWAFWIGWPSSGTFDRGALGSDRDSRGVLLKVGAELKQRPACASFMKYHAVRESWRHEPSRPGEQPIGR